MNSRRNYQSNFRYFWQLSSLLIMLICTQFATAAASTAATKLSEKHQTLANRLAHNPFNRPINLNSVESSSHLKGEIYGVINHPFSTVSSALTQPKNWCDVLILHINIKFCSASDTETNASMDSNKNNVKDNAKLTVFLGKKDQQALTDAYKVIFNYKNTSVNADYFAVALSADQGPLGTYDYKIAIEATPLKDGSTFLHFTYAYRFGLAGRLGIKGYLATAGKDKIGFTVINHQADKYTSKQANQPVDKPIYVKDVRGIVERNTMRYYLAIDAFLSALSITANNQFNARLENWFDATEQYAPQLHEVERIDYFTMKRAEYIRQQQE